MICITRQFYLEIHLVVALHNQVKEPIFLWSVMLKQKKLNNKLRAASVCIQDFGGATIKHKHHLFSSLVDDTLDIAVIHEGCNDLGYTNKEALSTDDIVIAILEIGKLCQSHGVKDISISSLRCRKNNFQNNKVNMINNFLRSVCDSLGLYFIGDSSLAPNHFPGDGIHLNYASTELNNLL